MTGAEMRVHNALHTTVEQALGWYPDLEISISDRPIRQQGERTVLAREIPNLSRRFREVRRHAPKAGSSRGLRRKRL